MTTIRVNAPAILTSLLGAILTANAAQTASAPASRPTTRPTTNRALEVAAIVNGVKIGENEVDGMLTTGRVGNEASEEAILQMRARYHDQIVAMLIEVRLMEQAIAKEKIEVTDEELRQEIDNQLNRYMADEGLTQEQFEELIENRTSMTYKEFIERRLKDPMQRTALQQTKLVEKKFPELLNVTDAEIQDFYKKNLEVRYKRPEMVKASHILFDTRELTSDEEKEQVKKKAETVLAEAKKPGADFGALAKQHSACPSSSSGGDLGYFPKKGVMVEPFAEAAFALKPGEISELVETPFGFHIIKQTEHKDATTIPYEQVKEKIALDLRNNKIREQVRLLIADMKKTAKIEYPPGKEPKSRPASQPAM